MSPILSICIPTYNRAAHLKATLDSIVAQREFCDGNDVEIVISDNCSSDDTCETAQAYVSKYPGKIVYHRNDTNIFTANCERVMSLGNGEFLKLHNDTALLHDRESIAKMLEIIQKARAQNALPFFLNGCCKAKDEFLVTSLDEFIRETKYWGTWICAFGLWRKDFTGVSEMMRETSKTLLSQSWVLLNAIAQGRKVLISNAHLFDVAPVSKKGGYNVAEVFGFNYNALLKELHDRGKLSPSVYKTAKRDILGFVNQFYFDTHRQFAFDKTGYFKWMFPFYKWNFYFYRKWLRMLFKKKKKTNK